MSARAAGGAEIRPYDASRDAAGLRACFVALQEFERTLEPTLPCGAEVADGYLTHVFARGAAWDGAVLVAEVEARIVGFVSVWARIPQDEPDEPPEDYAGISDLVVLPDYRNRGIGRALLGAAEDHARARGATSLRIGVLTHNSGAHRLYERVGFVDYRVQMTKRL